MPCATSSAVGGDELRSAPLRVIAWPEQRPANESNVAPRVEKLCGEGWIPLSASCDFVEQICWVERIVARTQKQGGNPDLSEDVNGAAPFVIVRCIAVPVYNGCERVVELL